MCYAFHEPLIFAAELTPCSRISLMKLTLSVIKYSTLPFMEPCPQKSIT